MLLIFAYQYGFDDVFPPNLRKLMYAFLIISTLIQTFQFVGLHPFIYSVKLTIVIRTVTLKEIGETGEGCYDFYKNVENSPFSMSKISDIFMVSNQTPSLLKDIIN